MLDINKFKFIKKYIYNFNLRIICLLKKNTFRVIVERKNKYIKNINKEKNVQARYKSEDK